MPSSSDQFPDPWNLNRPDDDDESTPKSEDNVSDGDDEFGLAELEALLSDTAQESEPEPSFDDLDALFGLGAPPPPEDSSDDFDAMLESLRLQSETSAAEKPEIDLNEPDLDFGFISTGGADSTSSPDPSELSGIQFNVNDEGPEESIVSGTDMPELDITTSGLSDLEISDDLTQATPSNLIDTDSSRDIDISDLEIQAPETPQISEDQAFPATPLIESTDDSLDLAVDLPSTSASGFEVPPSEDLDPIDDASLIPPAVSGLTSGITPVDDSFATNIDQGDVPEIASPIESSQFESEQLDPETTDLLEMTSPSVEDTGIDSASTAIPLSAADMSAISSASQTDSPDSPSLSDATNVSNPSNLDTTDTSTSKNMATSAGDAPLSSTPPVESDSTEDDVSETQTGLSGSTELVSSPMASSSSPPPASRPSSSPATPTGGTPAAAAMSASPTSPVSASGAGSTASSVSAGGGAGGTSTYKQLLSGRQQISAFAIVVAGMGGLTTYGLSKANIPNPLKAGLNDAGIGLIGDASSADSPLLGSAGDGGTRDANPQAAIAQNQDGEDNSAPNTVLTPTSPAIANNATNSGVSAFPTVGGIAASSDEDEEDANVSSSNEADDASANSGEENPNLQTPPPIDISDVPPEHWAHPYVVAMYEQGIIPDFPDGKFQPDKPVTRAELAASIQRAFKDQTGQAPIPFNDISEQYWAKDAITHAVNTGFMSGYSEDIFEPEQRIPRYQVLVSLVSGLGLEKIQDPQEATQTLESFPDIESMPDWALGQVAASKRADLIVNQPGAENELEPTRPATRAEVNAMIYQALVSAGKIEDTVNQ